MLTKHKIFIPPYNHRQMPNKHKIKKVLYSRMDADPANMIINLLYPLYFRMITYLAYLLHFPTLSLNKKISYTFSKNFLHPMEMLTKHNIYFILLYAGMTVD